MNAPRDTRPPRWMLNFFRWYCNRDFQEDIEGDLIERYQRSLNVNGKKKAYWHFLRDVLSLFRPGIIQPLLTIHNPIFHLIMFRHNLLITYRSFLRNKVSFFINLTGLSTGLTCILLIFLWVNDELKIDTFHEKDDQLYQVMHNDESPSEIVTGENTPVLLGNSLLNTIPEIEQTACLSALEESPSGILSNEENKIEVKGRYASQSFFEVFSFNLLEGDKKSVLEENTNIVISETTALNLFPSIRDAIGKTIVLNRRGRKFTFIVTGIVEDLPTYSTVQFDFLISMNVLLNTDEWASKWSSTYANTYLILEEGTDIDLFNKKIENFLEHKYENGEVNTLFVQKYSERYLFGEYEMGKVTGGRIEYVRLFSIIGIIILLIACINFMNLSTAQASKKMKEIGVKKAIGAQRQSLIIQFLGESMLITLLSLLVAGILVALLLPQFNFITGKVLSFTFRLNEWIVLFCLVIVTGLTAGSYPALYLSSFKPLTILKGKMKVHGGEIWLRRGLVIFQFSLTVIFIFGVLVINKQIEYTQQKHLGYNKENVIHFQMKGNSRDFSDAFMSELKNLPGVINTTNLNGGSIVANSNSGSGFTWDGPTSNPDENYPRLQVGYDFFETLDIKVLSGRSFSSVYGDESSKLMINEAAVKLIGIENIVGKTIRDGNRVKEIIGVVENFHIHSLHEELRPTFIRFVPGANVMVRIQTGNESMTLKQLETLYKKFHPLYAFNFTFIDEEYQSLYVAERRVAALSMYFTGLAIIISCLGLFGLATFTAEQRKKEISIRKVLGASSTQLVQLLSAGFTNMVILAIVIGLSTSYFLAEHWLQGFAYKIDLQFWYFAGVSILVLFISWMTVSIQTLKVARVNPVKNLKEE